MILYLTEKDVESLLTMRDALSVLEPALADLGRGKGVNKPRQVVELSPQARLSVLQAAIPVQEVMGFKTYTIGLKDALRFWVMLFGEDGELKCIMEAEYLSNIRTGAACGVATKYMARENSSTLGILGTGYNAPAQIEAVCAVRPIEKVLAYSRNRENLEVFCRGMSKHLRIPIVPAASAKEAVQSADIIVTITSSAEPVLFGEWLPRGVHLNLAGAMKPSRREVDTAAVQAADYLVVDDAKQSREESGEFIRAAQEGVFDWESLKELGSVVATGRNQRPSEDAITLFKNHGTGLWDIAVGARVYQLALAKKIGMQLPIAQPATPLYKGVSEQARIWAQS